MTTEQAESGIERFEVALVTWIDDDGTKYRREMVDGEIQDVPVGVER